MTEDALLAAARATWQMSDNPPTVMGVEEGIVWATAKGRAGYCGYALVPAEGHPWSKQWPIGRDQSEDHAEFSRWAKKFHDRVHIDGLTTEKAMIEVADDIPLRDGSMDDYVDVHGGVSWYQHPWIGFDCIHSGDVWPPELDPKDHCSIAREGNYTWRKDWTHELVIEEAKCLARQLAAVKDETALESDIDKFTAMSPQELEQAIGQLDEEEEK